MIDLEMQSTYFYNNFKIVRCLLKLQPFVG
jgi:hypothetical protein